MVLKLRGLQLPPWNTETGKAANRAWVEFLKREQRVMKTRVEFEMAAQYALAGSPGAEPEARFDAVDPAKQTYFAHLTGSVHRTDYRKRRIEEKIRAIESQVAEQDRVTWIASDKFSMADWIAGK